jgi:hypothetical protein
VIEFGKRCVIILRITKRNHLSGINTSYWSRTVGGHSRLLPCVGHSHPLLDFSAPPYLQIEDIYSFTYCYSSDLIDPPPLLTICLTHGTPSYSFSHTISHTYSPHHHPIPSLQSLLRHFLSIRLTNNFIFHSLSIAVSHHLPVEDNGPHCSLDDDILNVEIQQSNLLCISSNSRHTFPQHLRLPIRSKTQRTIQIWK